MPEFKRNFTKGRMNKDLDERMVPNGEYRDALNIEVATSEGSDVGTVQTLKGNTALTALFGNEASCVGTIADEKNNKVYWFVQDKITKNPDASVVYSQAEQDDATSLISVVHDVFSDYIMEYDEVKLEANYVAVEHWKVQTTITNDSHTAGKHLHISDFGYPGDIRYAGIQVGMEVQINNMVTTVIKIEADPNTSGNWNGWRVYTEHTASSLTGLGSITAGTTVTFVMPYRKRALGFKYFASKNPGKIITGINIIDDLLFWTDGLTEPKKINIKRCIYGSQQLNPTYQSTANIAAGVFPYLNGTRAFPTLLVVNGESPSSVNGRLGDIATYPSAITLPFLSYKQTTVIKKSPIEPLTLTMANTTKIQASPQDGLIITNTEVNISNNPNFFFTTAGERLANGDPTTPITFATPMDWAVNDIIEWYAEDDDAGFDNVAIATTMVDTISNNNQTFTFTIQSISNVLIKPYVDFRVRLQDEDPLFEFKFPRFAYRWKYEDGEYSCYSPFSDVAFLPEEFDYLPKKGYNLGMTNNLRYLVLSGFKPRTMPLDVVEIDILYKESNSPNIYTVDTIKAPSKRIKYLGTNNYDAIYAKAWFGEIKNNAGLYVESPSTLTTEPYLVGVSSLSGVDVDVLGVKYYVLEDNFTSINMKIGDNITLGTLGSIGSGTLKVSGMLSETVVGANGIDQIVTKISITEGVNLVTSTNINWLFLGNSVTFNREIAKRPAVYVDDPVGSLRIKSDMIHATVPSNQLLRPYDNVPKTALAQEITGNRVVYGNYTQNYDLKDKSNKLTAVEFETSIKERSNVRQNVRYDDRTALRHPNTGATLDWWHEANSIKRVPSKPERSLKSLRDYQVGVVYMDEFGRQTPIQTHDSAIRHLSKEYANAYNAIRIRLDTSISTFPKWATHFKFYIKENANEYYNLAMDRFYSADDGNVWLSFPSSERNKVDEETFLILKKQHDNDTFVREKARYKILAIENEAPLFVKTKMDSFGIVSSSSTNFAKIDGQFTDIAGGLFTNTSLADALDADNERVMRVSNATNKSRWYDVVSITGVGSNQRVTVSKPFGVDVAFTTDDNTSSGNYVGAVSIELAKKEVKNLPEFSGRFFVKIHKDGTFLKNITAKGVDRVFTTIDSMRVARLGDSPDYDLRRFWRGQGAFGTISTSYPGIPGGHWFVDEIKSQGSHPSHHSITPSGWHNGAGLRNSSGSWVNTSESKSSLDISYTQIMEGGDLWTIPGANPSAAKLSNRTKMKTAGTLFKFKGDTTIYKVTGSRELSLENWDGKDGAADFYQDATNHRVKIRVEFTPKLAAGNTVLDAVGQQCSDYNPFQMNLEGDGGSNGWKSNWDKDNNTKNQKRTIEFVEEFAADESYSSDNPAIWETEPKENVDIDLYNEASAGLPIKKEFDTFKNEFYKTGSHTSYNALDYYNCFSFNNGVESNRIRDDYNTVTIDKGPKVSTVLAQQYKEEHRKSGLIYSGIYNSTSGVNNLNQFIQAEKITKDINPTYGSIQKLYSRDTDLITFCEDRIIKVLANKDALFNADGNSNVTSTNNVLGNATPYAGDYGISTDPGSFAVDQYRAYFTDKSRGVVLRLSQDGLTPISEMGMRDYFKDVLRQHPIDLTGSYDENKKEYNLSITEGFLGDSESASSVALGFGCNDPLASNYDPLATIDDGTCTYNCSELDRLEVVELNDLKANVYTYAYSSFTNYIQGVFGPPYFPNNELAIQTFIASNSQNRGIDSDMRQVKFAHIIYGAAGSPTEDRTTLRITHVDLNDFYGYSVWFHTWREYIDAAIATGMMSALQTLQLLDPTKPNTAGAAAIAGASSSQEARGAGGYNINLWRVNTIIQAGFTQSYGDAPSPCAIWADANNRNKADCDRTFSTLCVDESGSTNVAVVVSAAATNNSNSTSGAGLVNITASFSEDSKGWTSFKSWLQQGGVSINDKYFTFSGGELYQHHSNETRNNFYGIQHFSTMCVLFNDMPSSVKSFSSLSYEGSQSQVEINLTDGEYYNNIAKTGWFAESIVTDLETGQIPEFREKEGKWFNFIRGSKVNNLANLEVKQFSTQGIGRLSAIAVTVDPPEVRNTLTVKDVGDTD